MKTTKIKSIKKLSSQSPRFDLTVENVHNYFANGILIHNCRAWWDGEKFLSRLGNEYHAPDWFKELMPKNVVLDGELFVGRGEFQKTVSTVRKLVPDDHEWGRVLYVIFDMPKLNSPFEERIEEMDKLLNDEDGNKLNSVVLKRLSYSVLPQQRCKGISHLRSYLEEIEAKGGEGVMLRKPGSLYEEGRSSTLLKVKTFKDDEAVVKKHIPGRGKHKGRLGALEVKWNGVTFKVGTGFSDDQRRNPPKIGSKVTFRYQELSSTGVPRFPSFVSARDYE